MKIHTFELRKKEWRSEYATAYVAYITALIIHLFILSSAFQMYEFSYIHFHKAPPAPPPARPWTYSVAKQRYKPWSLAMFEDQLQAWPQANFTQDLKRFEALQHGCQLKSYIKIRQGSHMRLFRKIINEGHDSWGIYSAAMLLKISAQCLVHLSMFIWGEVGRGGTEMWPLTVFSDLSKTSSHCLGYSQMPS